MEVGKTAATDGIQLSDACIIQAKDVDHYYVRADETKTQALSQITLNVKRGEFLAILGHNGSGKSTLAKHFNALLLPSSGVLYVDGMDTKDAELAWHVHQVAGMVFQNPDNQLVATVVEEDIAFGPENLGVPPAEIRQRVDAALDRVNMVEYARKAPHMLSGGQKQRVAIAGVLAMQPKVIIFDEATAMLDPRGRVEVMDAVRWLNEEMGITVILITHFMEEAIHADRVAVMDGGRIVACDAPAQVFLDIKRLRACGLDAPQMVQLRQALFDHGIALPPSILTVEDMAEALWQLLYKA